jgi:two-component system chemotaxis response regulator CheB
MSKRDIIAIGGSLGAIAAMKDICAGLPPGFPAAIFVVIHTAADRSHMFAEIFQNAGPLPAHTAIDNEPIGRGRIYVAPAGHHLLVTGDTVRLGRGPRENMSRPALDPLFRSIAASYRQRAIGVVLTGLLNDGAAGVAAIKHCGGIAIVQNPADAMAADMPLGALRTTDIDYRAPAADIAGILTRLVGQHVPPPAAAEVPPDLSLEVDIALGGPVTSALIERLGSPVAINCPACGGVLSEMKQRPPLRFRCQVGHAYTAEAVAVGQEGSIDEAIRVALRIIEERSLLVAKMACEASLMGRESIARNYRKRVKEYARYSNSLRRAIVNSSAPAAADDEPASQAAQGR